MRAATTIATPVQPMLHGPSDRALVSESYTRESWLDIQVKREAAGSRRFDGKPANLVASPPGGSSAQVPLGI